MKTEKRSNPTFFQEIRGGITYILMFATFFMIFGYFAPLIYYEYFDSKIYYDVKVPLPVDKKVYKPCEVVRQTVTRKALIDIDGRATIELVLIKEEGNEEVYRERQSFFTERTDDYETVIVGMPLPCTVEDGEYMFDGNIVYEANHVQHQLRVFSQEFFVEASPSGNLTD